MENIRNVDIFKEGVETAEFPPNIINNADRNMMNHKCLMEEVVDNIEQKSN